MERASPEELPVSGYRDSNILRAIYTHDSGAVDLHGCEYNSLYTRPRPHKTLSPEVIL